MIARLLIFELRFNFLCAPLCPLWLPFFVPFVVIRFAFDFRIFL